MNDYTHIIIGLPIMYLIVIVAMLVIIGAMCMDAMYGWRKAKERNEEVEFYNIFTYYHLNLFANDVLTSTSLNNIYPIKDMKFIKEDRKPVFDYTQFSDDWIVGARLKEQPTDVTEYCLDHIKLSKTDSTTQK